MVVADAIRSLMHNASERMIRGLLTAMNKRVLVLVMIFLIMLLELKVHIRISSCIIIFKILFGSVSVGLISTSLIRRGLGYNSQGCIYGWKFARLKPSEGWVLQTPVISILRLHPVLQVLSSFSGQSLLPLLLNLLLLFIH